MKRILTNRSAAATRRPYASALSALALCAALPLAPALAQQGQQEAPAAKPAAEGKQAASKKNFTLTVGGGPAHVFKLVANKAKLPEVAAQLSRRLRVPVHVSPQMQERQLTLDFTGLNLEATLRMLAPRPYVDYVAGGAGDTGQPRPLAIYLYGAEEPPPALNQTVRNTNEAMLIEGDTEEGTEEYEKRKKEEPLQVTFAENRLGVRAEKQPLAVVVYKVASTMGIPFELGNGETDLINLQFKGLPFDQAMRTISPKIVFYYRADLMNFETQPIRISLAGETAPLATDAAPAKEDKP